MKNKYPNIVRVLVALAMVISLVAVIAAPVGAQSVDAVVLSPNKASVTAGYTVTITTTLPLNAGDSITLEFPEEVTLPSVIDDDYALVDGKPVTANPSVDQAEDTVTITLASAVAAGTFDVALSQGAGIKNPSIAKKTTADDPTVTSPYEIDVSTSVEGPIGAREFMIIPTYKLSKSSGTYSDMITVTGVGWPKNSAMLVLGGVGGSGMTEDDGTFSIMCLAKESAAVNCIDGEGHGTPTSSNNYWTTVVEPTFTLKAKVEVSPTSGNVGSKITVKGYDFTPGEQININGITMGGQNWGPAVAVDLASLDGRGANDDFEIELDCLHTIKRSQTIQVIDSAGKSASTSFFINAPTLTVSPPNASPTSWVTITGQYFAAGDKIPVNNSFGAGGQFGGIWMGLPDPGAASWNRTAIDIDASGTWTVSIKVPLEAAEGSYELIGWSEKGTTGKALFVVGERALSLQPSSGPIGTKVTITGSDMTEGSEIPLNKLTFAGIGWNDDDAADIDSQGNIEPITLEVPKNVPTGPNKVKAEDKGPDGKFGNAADDADNIASEGSFEVTQPTMAVTPTKGYRGDTISLSGAGWVPGARGLVTVEFGGDVMLVTTPNSEGKFSAQFVIPSDADDSELISADDSFGNKARDITFLLDDPELMVNPESGPVGTEALLTGKGFQPRTGVAELKIGGATILPTSPLITDQLGAFTYTFTVPGLAEEAQTIETEIGDDTATTFFTITEAPDTVESATSSIADQLVRVWGYNAVDGWQMYDPADTIGSDLDGLIDGRGYWMKVSEECTLVYLGKSINLDSGWNLIGW
ncbi:MAG: hypothetical protein SVO26_08000 [Chloroflexota bacterium]|nr:hypothetical protein [Chloroflexota bacterium]